MRDPIEVCCRIERPNIAHTQSNRHRIPRLKECAEGGKLHGEVWVSLHSLPRATDIISLPSVFLGSLLDEDFPAAAIKGAGKWSSRSITLFS